MRLIVIYLGFMVSAQGREPNTDEYSSFYDQSLEDGWPIVSGYFNLEGGVRREFALEAALEEHPGNMICSPMSVMMPLGKLAMGAGERTEKELFNALHLVSRKLLNPTFAQLVTHMEYLPGVTLHMANRIYVSTKNIINKKFAHDAKLIFKSSIEKIRTSEPKKAAHTINRWVAEKTRNKIKHLVSSRDITEDTSLILVNAIYFAGKWLNKFDKIFMDDFFSPAGKHRILMMWRQGRFNYWQCDILKAKIIEIPYEGSQSAMIVVLPSSSSNLLQVLRKLKDKPDLLNSALKKMKLTDLKLTMPKFKIETEMDLVDLYRKRAFVFIQAVVLHPGQIQGGIYTNDSRPESIIKWIGVKTIFDHRHADLNGIIDGENVFVTKAIHKATIEVNELGTEATAATGFCDVANSLDERS